MKSIILYESKTDTTKKCAQILKEENPDAKIERLSNFVDYIDEYESIVLLTPIYMGQINKKIKKFILKNHAKLLAKKLTILICSMNTQEYDNTVTNNFDEAIRNHASIIHAGGAYNFDKLNFLYKFIIKKMTGITKDVDEIKYEVIKKIRT